MNSEPSKMSGEEFSKRLSEGKLPPKTLKFKGWAKSSPEKDCISFSPLNTCSVWIDLPNAMVAEVQITGEAPCADHVHTVVLISVIESSDINIRTICQLLGALAAQQGLSHKYKARQPFEKSDIPFTNRPTRRYGLRPPPASPYRRLCSTCDWVCERYGEDSRKCEVCRNNCDWDPLPPTDPICYEDENGFLVCY